MKIFFKFSYKALSTKEKAPTKIFAETFLNLKTYTQF